MTKIPGGPVRAAPRYPSPPFDAGGYLEAVRPAEPTGSAHANPHPGTDAVSAHILVVDDEPDIAAMVAYHLARESYRVRTVGSGSEALDAVERERPDLIVLDLMLPEMSGLDVLRELRGRPEFESLPVILLTARREEDDRVEGLSLGADDYVSKPFSPQELVLRVGAVLRRVRQHPPAEKGGQILKAGPVSIDTGAAQASVDGQVLTLTPTEYRLLQVLIERQGRVQSRRQLLESVWDTTANITTRTVDMHVQRLRSKLGAAADWLETVRGFGYRFRGE
jgi:two-component system, OmpR family, phosphate regulon response regulator PhoB